MPGRLAFWVIVTGTEPSAFRARDPEDLLPTLKQLQRTQPDAVLKWFERGRLWGSRLEASEALRARPKRKPSASRGWRPGGQHADPSAAYALTRDEKRRRFKQRRSRVTTKQDSGISPKPGGKRRKRD